MKTIIFFFILYPPLVAAKLLAMLLGLVVVPIAIPFGYVTEPPSREDKSNRKVYEGWEYRALPGWAQWLWGNDKYGAYGNYFWDDMHPDPEEYWPQFVWLAIRNPANNLNNFKLFKPTVSSVDIKIYGAKQVNDTKGQAGFQLITAGWLAGIYWILPYGNGRSLKVKLGFGISPMTNGPVSLEFIPGHPWAKFGKDN